jgi:hypothetical protein
LQVVSGSFRETAHETGHSALECTSDQSVCSSHPAMSRVVGRSAHWERGGHTGRPFRIASDPGYGLIRQAGQLSDQRLRSPVEIVADVGVAVGRVVA